MRLSLGLGPGTAVIGVLGAAVLFVSVYVLTSNTISDRQAKLATLQGQVTLVQAQASRLANYAAFVKLAQARVDTATASSFPLVNGLRSASTTRTPAKNAAARARVVAP